MIDIFVNVIQGPCRALVADLVSPEDLQTGRKKKEKKEKKENSIKAYVASIESFFSLIFDF